MPDWERFEIFIHSSGTVAAEVGRITFYTFRQQIAECVRLDSILEVLEPRTSESEPEFGSYCIKRIGQSQFVSIPARRTDGLVEFVESVVLRLDHRFHDQCRKILETTSAAR